MRQAIHTVTPTVQTVQTVHCSILHTVLDMDTQDSHRTRREMMRCYDAMLVRIHEHHVTRDHGSGSTMTSYPSMLGSGTAEQVPYSSTYSSGDRKPVLLSRFHSDQTPPSHSSPR